MQAKQFNETYEVGSHFIYAPNPVLRGGTIVKTVDVARDLSESTVVEINIEPWFANTKSLTPAG
uniref:hypothetical protein n=1 Tax=Serratia proteamaculans TaxID=28151 RepID=UPI001F4BD164|nr:hypothetical protein [Serratia proteamaculans]ULG15527.1 hypothetical protein 465p1_00122 [Serratia proteamaculans]